VECVAEDDAVKGAALDEEPVPFVPELVANVIKLFTAVIYGFFVICYIVCHLEAFSAYLLYRTLA
jgi:hypothetical protein